MYLVPSRWASTAPAVSARLGWQQFSGIEIFQLWLALWRSWFSLMLMRRKRPVCLLGSPTLRQRMGRSASDRARELFAENVVMNQYEELFDELAQRRLAAPPEARRETYASKYGSGACLSGLSQPSMATCRE